MNRYLKIFIVTAILSIVIVGCNGKNDENENTQVSVVSSKPTPTAEQPLTIEEASPADEASTTFESGELIYKSDFSDIEDWQFLTEDDPDDYIIESRWDGIFIEVPEKYDSVLGHYVARTDLADVHITSIVSLVGGGNSTDLVLTCRGSENGEYHFVLNAGGFWAIKKRDIKLDEYIVLDSGGSPVTRVGKHENTLEAICEGKELTILINGNKMGEVEDGQYTEGTIGIAVFTAKNPPSQVSFLGIEVSAP